MAMLMLEKMLLFGCHSEQKSAEITKRADILIVAIGKSKFITRKYKDGAIVIDVGMHR